MKKIKSTINKYWTWLIVGFIPIILAVTLIGTYFFFTTDDCVPHGEGIGRSGWLVFWGSFLSLCGTVILSTISVLQNNRASKLAKAAHNLSERVIIYEKMVVVDVKTLDDYDVNFWGQHTNPQHFTLESKVATTHLLAENEKLHLLLDIRNDSDSVLKEIQLINKGKIIFSSNLTVLGKTSAKLTLILHIHLMDDFSSEIEILFGGMYGIYSYGIIRIELFAGGKYTGAMIKSYIFGGIKVTPHVKNLEP